MTRRDVDEVVLRIARNQEWVFTWDQALAAGATPNMITRRVATGQWRRLTARVYVLAASLNTWRQRLKAAELSLPGCVVSGRSALQLHELPGGHTGVPQLSIAPGRSFRTPLGNVRRSAVLATTRVQGFRSVTAEQAVFDLAADGSFAEVERAMDHALLDHRATVARFERRLAAVTGKRWPGVAMLRALLAERGPGWVVPESDLERVLYRILDLAGVPDVVRQAHPPWSPGDRRRFDALSGPWRTIYEGDGRLWHSRMKDMERDRARDQEAAAHGYLVLRFTWAQLTQARSDSIEIIRAAGRWRSAAA